MVSMDMDIILQDLDRRFATPLPEFYKRRIIIWHDEDGEFADKISEITLTNAKVVAPTGTNYFSTKNCLVLMIPPATTLYTAPSPMNRRKITGSWISNCTVRSSAPILFLCG